MNKKCPICKRPTDTLRTGIKKGVYLSERCDRCLNSSTGISLYARQYNRNKDKRDHAKDTIQRFEGTEINPAFVDAYPEEAQKQWGPDVLRDYGANRKQF